jgi:hypothetical protein
MPGPGVANHSRPCFFDQHHRSAFATEIRVEFVGRAGRQRTHWGLHFGLSAMEWASPNGPGCSGALHIPPL